MILFLTRTDSGYSRRVFDQTQQKPVTPVQIIVSDLSQRSLIGHFKGDIPYYCA